MLNETPLSDIVDAERVFDIKLDAVIFFVAPPFTIGRTSFTDGFVAVVSSEIF